MATYRRRRPRPEDVVLLVEVADSSGLYDRNVKVPLYAGAGILEYWLVDLGRNVIQVYRSPSEGRYASVEELQPGDELAALAQPTVKLSVSEVLGTS